MDRSCTSPEWATSWEDDGWLQGRVESQRGPRVQFRTRASTRVVKAGLGGVEGFIWHRKVKLTLAEAHGGRSQRDTLGLQGFKWISGSGVHGTPPTSGIK